MCQHDVETKVENGMIITFCKKCGKILDTRPISTNITCDSVKINWNEGGIKNNGGQILHD